MTTQYQAFMIPDNVRALVEAERLNQVILWGSGSDNPDPIWMSILAEEMGETAKEVQNIFFSEYDPDYAAQKALQTELAQVAAVAITWLERLTNGSRGSVQSGAD